MAAPTIGRHPMLREIALALRHAPSDAYAYVFAPAELQRFQQQALRIAHGAELYVLVGDLLTFAAFLRERQRSPQAAAALLEMVRPVMARLQALARQDGRGAEKRADAIKRQIDLEQAALGKPAGTAQGIAPAQGGGVGLRKHRF